MDTYYVYIQTTSTFSVLRQQFISKADSAFHHSVRGIFFLFYLLVKKREKDDLSVVLTVI